MLDLSQVTDGDVAAYLVRAVAGAAPGTDAWRLLGFCASVQSKYSFGATRTYPRPDHPDPTKRLPLSFLMVGILVSLRTTLENEQKAMGKLISRFPTETELFRAEVSEIATCINCAGMPQVKSRRIRQALDHAAALPGGLEGLASLSRGEARATVLALPGFGPKAADCMLTIGLGIPSMVVDVNVFRVSSALLGMPWADSPDYANAVQVGEIKNRLDAVVGDDAFLCQIVHTFLLMHGKQTRLRAHSSAGCQLGRFCRACEMALEARAA